MTQRGNWDNWYQFLLSCIGSLVGLGNIWRFPYLCYKNGGGAFLIPYVLFLFLCGVPIVYLEMSYCQFSNLSPAKAWICVPLLRGIGFGMVSLAGIASIYYNVIIAWTIYYFISTFTKTLPWTTCDNDWNTPACYLRLEGNRSLLKNISNSNNSNTETDDIGLVRKTATEEFWDNRVLERSSGIEELGSIRWELFGCLTLAWIVVVLSLIKGIKSSGKVMYVAATLPYLLLLILLCRAATLDGAIDGLRYYTIPKWDKLTSLTVWGNAAVQMIYSAGIGSGAMGTLASYNKFHNNVQRDSTILPFIDLFTSWFSGCVIFISLGFMAKSAGLSIDEVVNQGPGIAFMVYPEALSQLPLPQLWSVIFFLALMIVGLDSQIVHIQIVTTALMDQFPKVFRGREMALTILLCVVGLVLGIPCVTQRGNWDNWYQFLLSCIGSLVGLGNIWRFPYRCYKNGGGAFLIPYVLFLFLCGVPIVYLEMSYCQFSNLSPAKAWICVPLLRGIGFGMVSLAGIASIYYNVIIAWTIYYFISTFTKTLPWTTCDNDWNTPACYLRLEGNVSSLNATLKIGNITTDSVLFRKTATEEFWDNRVLERSSGIEELGSVRWELFGCLTLAWIVVVLSLVKGIKSSGKVMYVAATLPYLLLLILLCRAATLDGAIDGLRYYTIPKWDKLTSLTVWGDAAVQMIYSAGIGSGAMGTLAITSSITMYKGPGIAFMVYPEALSQLPLPQLWSVIFFLALMIVGLDSQIVHIQIVTTALMDQFPKMFRGREMTLTILLCVVGLVLGIPCVTQGGVYVLQVMDWYLASIGLILMPLFEVVGQSWGYGVDRLCDDIALMLGHKISPVWKWFWKYVTPAGLLLIWLFNLVKLQPVSYGDKIFPSWAIGVGWVIAAVPLSLVVVPSIMQLVKAKGASLMEKIKASLIPDEEWGPADEEKRDLYKSKNKAETINLM